MHLEDITILNNYAPYKRASNYIAAETDRTKKEKH